LARKIVARIPASSTRRINAVMGDKFVTKYGESGGIVLADVAEREVGSALGAFTNAAFAEYVIWAQKISGGPAHHVASAHKNDSAP
jgi:hypothetical protein